MRRALIPIFLLFAAAVLTAGQEEVFEKAFSMEGVSRVTVENVNGRVEAIAWEKPYVKVRAVKNASGSGAEETLRLRFQELQRRNAVLMGEERKLRERVQHLEKVNAILRQSVQKYEASPPTPRGSQNTTPRGGHWQR